MVPGTVPAPERSAMQSKPFAFVAAASLVALSAAGCAKGSDQSSSSTTTTTTGSTTSTPATTGPMSVSPGDAVHGKTIFATNCATCHGAGGESGGVGPSL